MGHGVGDLEVNFQLRSKTAPHSTEQGTSGLTERDDFMQHEVPNETTTVAFGPPEKCTI